MVTKYIIQVDLGGDNFYETVHHGVLPSIEKAWEFNSESLAAKYMNRAAYGGPVRVIPVQVEEGE